MGVFVDVAKVLARKEALPLSELSSALEVYDRAVVCYQEAANLEEQTKMLQMLTDFAEKLKPLMLQLVEQNAALKQALILRNAEREVEELEFKGKVDALKGKAQTIADQRKALEEEKKAAVAELQKAKGQLLELGEKVSDLAKKAGVS